jgi:hypothetical protein
MVFLSTKNLKLFILIFVSVCFSCKVKIITPKEENSTSRLKKLQSEMNIIGEYGIGDTNLFSRSLICTYPSSTTTIVIRISELRCDTFSTMSLTFICFTCHNQQSNEDRNKLPYLAVKNLRRISKVQSDKIFAFCDKYLHSKIFYTLGNPPQKVKPLEYTQEESDRIIYTKNDSVYEYSYYDYPKSNEIATLYEYINEVCEYKKMGDDMKFPWIDSNGYYDENWKIVGGRCKSQ